MRFGKSNPAPTDQFATGNTSTEGAADTDSMGLPEGSPREEALDKREARDQGEGGKGPAHAAPRGKSWLHSHH